MVIGNGNASNNNDDNNNNNQVTNQILRIS